MPKKSDTVYEEACDLIATQIEKLDARRALLVEAWEKLGGVAEIEGEGEVEAPKLIEGPKKKKRTAKANTAAVRHANGKGPVEFDGHVLRLSPQHERLLDALQLDDSGLAAAEAQALFTNIANFNYGLGRLRAALRPLGWQIVYEDLSYRLVKG